MLTKKTQLGPVAPWVYQWDKRSELLILEVSMIGGFPDTATQEKPGWVDGGVASNVSLVSCCGGPGVAGV